MITFCPANIHQNSYLITQQRADQLVARGFAEYSGRILRERTSKPRGEHRQWRAVQRRTRLGACLYKTMQLVPGYSYQGITPQRGLGPSNAKRAKSDPKPSPAS